MNDNKLSTQDFHSVYEQLSKKILEKKGRRIIAVSAIGSAILMASNPQDVQAQAYFEEPVPYPGGIEVDTTNFPLQAEYHDINNDGNKDLIGTTVTENGYYLSDIVYFENNGTNEMPSFGPAEIIPTNLEEPFLDVFTFGDLDNDGDIDGLQTIFTYDTVKMVIEKDFLYYENQSPDSLTFKQPVFNPFGLDSFQSESIYTFNKLIDVDKDGDLDMLVSELFIGFGYYDNQFTYIENIGSADSANFSAPRVVINNPQFNGPIVFSEFGDIDRDGDVDILSLGYNISTYESQYIFIENTSTTPQPLFKNFDIEPFNLELMSSEGEFPTLLDFDNDGDLDLMAVSGYEPLVKLYENTDINLARQIALSDLGVEIYPNPVSEILKVKLPTLFDGEVQLLTVSGQKIDQKTIENYEIEFNVSALPSGVYFIRVDSDHVEGYQRFVKK